MAKAISHVVTRPGLKPEDPDIEIPVAQDLVTVPGIPMREDDVAFYSREDPLESQTVEKSADREWVWTVYSDEVAEYRRRHDEAIKPQVQSAEVSSKV